MVPASQLAKLEEEDREERMLQSAIQKAHKKAREQTKEKAFIRAEISDKRVAQNTEQSTELFVQSACDQIKSGEDWMEETKEVLDSKFFLWFGKRRQLRKILKSLETTKCHDQDESHVRSRLTP